jgi:type IV pilus assembly protein PilO
MRIGAHGQVLLLAAVALPVASYFLVFRPQNREITRAREEVTHKQSMLVKLREETARNDDLLKTNDQTRTTVAMIESRLPSGKELDAVVRQVSDLAVAAGLASPAIKSAKPVPAALYMEQPLEIQISGSFLGFHSFIAQIEKLPRITRIHDLNITSTNRDDRELTAKFTLSIYFQPESAASLASAGSGGTKP